LKSGAFCYYFVNGLAWYPGIKPIVIYAGQHQDKEMPKLFFDEFGITQPDIKLDELGSAPHGLQTAGIMKRFEGRVLYNL
jgi:UDP-N-acetylglucosamine 2-epimerase